jgi:hypothetical protein
MILATVSHRGVCVPRRLGHSCFRPAGATTRILGVGPIACQMITLDPAKSPLSLESSLLVSSMVPILHALCSTWQHGVGLAA